MRKAWWGTGTAVVIGLGGLLGTSAIAADSDTSSRVGYVRAAIHDTDGNRVGSFKALPAGKGKTRLSARAWNLPPGYHGFHIHEFGECDPDAVDPETGERSPFRTAGGHFNPEGTDHGQHAGDMPALLINEDGTGRLEVVSDRLSARRLLNLDSVAVIVHAGRDNLANIPERYAPDGPDKDTLNTGDAGGRIACGVLRHSR